MDLDVSGWSGEGTFTERLIEALKEQPAINFLKVEDAPASRSDAAFCFISNEVYVKFAPRPRERTTLATLSSALEAVSGIGAPDYEDDGMLQYLRTERIIPPYQTRGYKLIELVRIYAAGSSSQP